MTLAHADYLAHLRRESARFLQVLRDHPADAPVPSCPEWRADDLLWHLGRVQWFWGTVVLHRLQDVEALEAPERPGSRESLATFFEEHGERLHEALAAADPAEPVYMWSSDRTVGYVARRQAHEALIHRLDAELTVGTVTALDPVLAGDGVEEALSIMFGGCPPWGTFTPGADHLHVAATDTAVVVPVVLGRFTGTDPSSGTTYDEDDLSVRAADPQAQPRVTVRGAAEDLDAWLWHRRDATGIVVEGDREVFERLERILAQPIE